MASPLSLELVINARRMKQGADEAKRSTKELGTEAVNTGRKVDGLDKELDRTGKTATKTGRNLKEAGTGARALGSAASVASRAVRTLAAGFGAYALARKSIGTIAGFEESIAQLRGVTGASGDALASLTGAARDAGANTRYTAREAAQGLLELARAGLTVKQSTVALTPSLNLATAGMLSLAESADLVTNVAAQFRLPAAQIERIGDVLVAVSNRSNTNVSQLGQAMKDVGVVANQIGVPLEDTAAVLGVLANRGLKGSDGAIKLRQAFLQLLDPSSEAVQTLGKMGLTMSDVDIRSRGLESVLVSLKNANLDLVDASRLVGVRNAAALIELTQGVGEWRKMRDAVTGVSGDMQKQADILNNTVIGRWKALGSAFDEVLLSVGDAGLAGALKDVIDGLREGILLADKFADSLRVSDSLLQRVSPRTLEGGPPLDGDPIRRVNRQRIGNRPFGPQTQPPGYRPLTDGVIYSPDGSVVYGAPPDIQGPSWNGIRTSSGARTGPDVPPGFFGEPQGPAYNPADQFYRGESSLSPKATEASAAVRDLSAGLAELASVAVTSAGDLRQATLQIARSFVQGYARSAFQTGFQSLLGGTSKQTGATQAGGEGVRVTPGS